MHFASAEEAESYLLGFINYEHLTGYSQDTRSHDLVRFRERLMACGWQPEAVPTIHVAGTNGKGTVATLIERMLRAGGLRTGLFTSPHLQSMRERIRLGGLPMEEDAFRRGVGELATTFQASPQAGFRTVFEHLTALAFMSFQQARVDVAVVEVGLGGRLDATNVVAPGLVVFTPISLDHAQILGRTVGLIARDKAHVLKPGGLAISMPQSAQARAALVERSTLTGGGLQWSQSVSPTRVGSADHTGQRVDIPGLGLKGLPTGLWGRHQAQNISAVVSVGHHFLDPEVLPEAVREAVRCPVPGRMESVTHEGVRFLLDGGHNPAAARSIARALATHVPAETVVGVIGMARDKDHRRFLAPLAGVLKHVVFTQSGNPRAATPESLLAAYQGSAETCETLELALARARRLGADRVLVAGSFLIAGESRRLMCLPLV